MVFRRWFSAHPKGKFPRGQSMFCALFAEMNASTIFALTRIPAQALTPREAALSRDRD